MMLRIALVTVAAGVALGSPAAVAGLCDSADACLSAIAPAEDARVRAALELIPDTGRKLLALHSYLRAGTSLPQRWSWSEAQVETFAGSGHERELGAAIQDVRAAFEHQNPGFTLSVNPQVRTLARQLQAWNTNRSVAVAASEFQAAASREIRSAASAGHSGISPQVFTRFVTQYEPRPSPNLAAPGLSRHGQMYAVDFHVRTATATVADTDSATIATVWIAQGWEQRLHSAVVASGAPFAGPLQVPHEPWHYDYQPPPSIPEAPGSR